jgi:hypothetical protein
LDGVGDDAAGAFLGGRLGFGLDAADQQRRVAADGVLLAGQQFRAGLVDRE